jgi:hypothetical protein
MTSAATDGRVARQRWDQACAAADDALHTSRAAAQEAGQDWLVRWFTTGSDPSTRGDVSPLCTPGVGGIVAWFGMCGSPPSTS